MQVKLYWRCFPYISEASILIIIKLLVLILLQLWILLPLMAMGSPTGLHTFLTRSQMAMHCGESTFDVKKTNEHVLKGFWMRHPRNNTLAAGVKWVIISESHSFQLDSREDSFVRIWYCLPKIYSCLCWNVIHLEEALTLCELGQPHQCTSRATLLVTMPLSVAQQSQLSAGPWKSPLRK